MEIYGAETVSIKLISNYFSDGAVPQEVMFDEHTKLSFVPFSHKNAQCYYYLLWPAVKNDPRDGSTKNVYWQIEIRILMVWDDVICHVKTQRGQKVTDLPNSCRMHIFTLLDIRVKPSQYHTITGITKRYEWPFYQHNAVFRRLMKQNQLCDYLLRYRDAWKYPSVRLWIPGHRVDEQPLWIFAMSLKTMRVDSPAGLKPASSPQANSNHTAKTTTWSLWRRTQKEYAHTTMNTCDGCIVSADSAYAAKSEAAIWTSTFV